LHIEQIKKEIQVVQGKLMSNPDSDFNKIIHEKVRLRIMSFLVSSPKEKAGFTHIKDALALSSGNLSIQIKTLEEAGYVQVKKSFKNNKPYTEVILSSEGHKALVEYIEKMETFLTVLKQAKEKGK